MSLVAPVDSDEVGGEGLHLACVAKPPGVDAAHTRNGGSEFTYQRHRVAVLTQHQHVIGKVIDGWIIEKNGADVMESCDHCGVGEQLLRFLSRGAGGHSQREWPSLIEPEWVDAVDD